MITGAADGRRDPGGSSHGADGLMPQTREHIPARQISGPASSVFPNKADMVDDLTSRTWSRWRSRSQFRTVHKFPGDEIPITGLGADGARGEPDLGVQGGGGS